MRIFMARYTLQMKSMTLVVVLALMPLFAVTKSYAEKATIYSDKYQGKKTASGARYNKMAMTAASSTLPLGSKVRVRNVHNGRSALVVINDRKAHGGAKIDLSKMAAKNLGIKGTGSITTSKVK